MPITKEERERRKRVRRQWQLLRRGRQVVQVVLLALFLFLVWSTVKDNAGSMPVNLFSRFDPLMALVSFVGSRSLISNMIPALITVVVTLLVGRVWCGWICPLGTVLDQYGPNIRKGIPQWFRHIKYFVLFAFVGAALLGSLALMWMDPITIFVRPLAGAIFPAILQQISPIEPGAAVAGARAAEIPLKPVVYPLLALPLLLVLATNLVVRRFWCRYLCPLGAWVAFLSKFSFLKRFVNEDCVKCKQCLSECPMDTINEEDFSSDPGECLQCLNCYQRCPTAAITFKGGWRPGFGYPYDPERRKVVVAAAAGVGGAALFTTGLLERDYPFRLRPPGAQEDDFLGKCVRCGQCIKVCPNNALHLALFEAGLESVWSPLLVPRIGNCNWDCNACGQICPTQAIPPLSLEEKRQAKIGTAVVDFGACIRCLICIRECPVEGAIASREVEGYDGQYPVVDAAHCIGCGVCEFVCPVEGESAIRVYAPTVSIPAPPPPPQPTAVPTPAAGETAEPAASAEPAATPTAQPGELYAYVDRELCIRCMICVTVCPFTAVEEVLDNDDTKWPQVMTDVCTGCGTCYEECPVDPKAITLYPPEELPTA